MIKTHRYPDGIDLGVGDVQFNLLEGNILIGFAFYGRENRSLDEARLKSEAFAEMFGQNVTRRAELDTFETKHDADYGGRGLDIPEIGRHVDLDTATNAAKVGDFSIIYGFRLSQTKTLPSQTQKLPCRTPSARTKTSKSLDLPRNPNWRKTKPPRKTKTFCYGSSVGCF